MTPESLTVVLVDIYKAPLAGFGLSLEKLPWVILGWCLLALFAFLVALWPKVHMLRLSQADYRLNDSTRRLWNTLTIAFAQTKMFKDGKAGWMHAFIFWGFLVLLIRALQFFVIGLFPETQEFLLVPSENNGLIAAYTMVKNFIVWLVILATLYALYRRLVVKPKRLTLSSEGIVILELILIIMVSDLGFDVGHKAYAEGFVSASPLMNVSYWTHIITILVFLNVLPRSKHFHIITSIPNVYFSNAEGRGNQLHRLDFEAEDQESFGITKIEEFTWKNMLDFHTCTECGRCDVFCPALNSDKPLSPKQLTVDLRDHMNSMTPALIGNSKAERPALMGDVIQDETVWSCTTCGACEEECPVMIEYVNKIIGLRQGLVMMDNRYPEELTQAFKSLETHSNPWGFPASQRTNWAEGLDVPIWDKENPTEYLYFVGCNGSFDQRGKSISRATVSALQKAGVSFSILGNCEGCTGDPARRLGNEYLFDMLASANAETLKEERVQKVVVHCPHCFNSFANEYQEFGVKLEVIHHSQLIEQLMAEGRLKPEGKVDGSVVVHDSCYMGRHNNEYEAPRKVLSGMISPSNIKEVDTSRERGSCCGAGGGRFLLEENTGSRMSHNRLDELLEAQTDTIAVSCPYCVLMLEDAAKSKGQSVKVRDISELLKE